MPELVDFLGKRIACSQGVNVVIIQLEDLLRFMADCMDG